jgi:hypothetical protein
MQDDQLFPPGARRQYQISSRPRARRHAPSIGSRDRIQAVGQAHAPAGD